jgi:ABC-2 type transport system ATP-binding protein
MITVKNLTKKFDSFKAVDGISFSVEKGEIVGLLGPNGAGKTTTMRMLTSFLSADAGSVKIDEIDIEKDPVAAQKKIGYLPENNPLYKNMQVAEFLELASQLHQIKEADKKEALDFAVKAVGIEKVYYRSIGELSKGYKQRVGIAAALIHRPEIIILDEPTEGLDPNQRAEIRQLIKDLSKEHTIIMSTHVMQEASAVCNRMLIINKGKIIADGKPEDLAKLSQKEMILNLEIEGEQIEEKLRALPKIKELKVISKQDKKIKLEIIPEADQSLEPLIAQKIWENRWIVWKLERQESNLEEIFQALTKE